MPDQNVEQKNDLPNAAATHGSIQQPAADDGIVPQAAADYGSVPQDAERHGNTRHAAKRKETHALTVKEVARMFEAAGVSRIERTISSWCQPNRQGIARLDAYFAENERRWLITPESVERAIAEEKSKLPNDEEPQPQPAAADLPEPKRQNVAEPGVREVDSEQLGQLQKEIMDLKITNRAKDYFIEQLKEDREHFQLERQNYVQQLINSNRKVDQLESKLLQLEAPTGEARDTGNEVTRSN